MSSVEEDGIYSVAHRFASIVMVASYAFGQAWAPLALKSRVDEPQSYRRMYADVLLVLACGMLVLGGSIAIFSRELIGLLMPAEYGAAARPLAILCFGVILQSTTQVTAIGISLDNKTALFARLSWITAGVNLVFKLLLIPGLGATGAALATSLSYLFLTSCYLYFTQRLLGVLPVICKDADKIPDGAKVTVNLKKGFIEEDGKKFMIEPVPEFMQGIIDAGGLVEFAKNLKELPVCTKSQR